MTTELLLVMTEGQVLHAAVPPGEYLIGCGEDAGLRLEDPSVSPAHARLVVEDNTITIEDLGSEHGTFIEEEAVVGATALYDGQTARVGNVRLRVRQTTDPRTTGEEPRYQRGQAVAAGGMGMIHEARQTAMGRKVAMKVMLHAWHERSVGRFLDEARITGMLEHPNIVPVHELGVDGDGQLFYTMKFVRGVTLAEVVAGLGLGRPEAARQYSLATLLTIFQKVCDAVAFAHSRGVWHRDLKPENIMIGDYGEVLVMDWGLAKEAGFGRVEASIEEEEAPVEAAPGRTMEGTVLGTPTYMAPEQARGEVSEVDHRADVYALGAILHEILYLQPPVRGTDRDELVRKVGEGVLDRPEPRPTLHLPAQRVPESLAAVCRKAMAFARDGRYQQVPDLQADITAYQSGFATSAEQAGAAKQFALFVKRNRRASIAVAAALVSLAAVSAWFTFHLVQARWEAEQNAIAAEEGRREAESQKLVAQEQTRRAEEKERVAREQEQIAKKNLELATTAQRGQKEAETQRDSALEELVAAAGGMSEAAEQQLAQAENFILQERADEALRVLEAAIELAPADPRFRARRGDLRQSLWRFDEAVQDYEAALARGPDERIARNLELSRELAAAGAASEEARRTLEAELMAQDREAEIPLMYTAADRESVAAGEVSAQDLLLARLKPYVSQKRWPGKNRVKVLSDDALALDLSGLEVADLSMLRGTGVRELNLADTNIGDLALLRGLKLSRLDLTRTSVTDLEPLSAMPLEYLQLLGSRIETLERLRGMPLRELHADAPSLQDFAALGSLRQLEVLTLPAQAAGVDLVGATALRTVAHARFDPASPLPADRFRELSARSDEEWKRWSPELRKLPSLEKIGPERLTVRGEEGVDLDLRGTGLRDLTLPADLPLRRLEIDTADALLDLSPLAGRGTLRELDLQGANVASLAPVLKGSKIESITLDRDVTDLDALRQIPSLQRAGFSREPNGLRARNTAEEFFGARSLLKGTAKTSDKTPAPKAKESFDDPEKASAGWRVVLRDGETSPKFGRLSWVPDPVPEGGRGGGHLTYLERSDDSKLAYFSLPPDLFKPLGDLLGYTLEFDIRRPVRGVYQSYAGADLEISNGEKAIIRQLPGGPKLSWMRFVVSLDMGSWQEVGREDRAAPESLVRAVLGKPQRILIRAEYENRGTFHGVDLDDVEFWDPSVVRRPLGHHGG